MNEKVIDFELQYFLNKQKEAQEKIKNHEFQSVIETLKEPMEKIEELANTEIYCPQNLFESAVCLNYLGKEVHQNSFAKINFYDFYLMLAASYYNLNKLDESQKYYKMAIKLDPVSSIARQYDIEIDLKNKHYDDVLNNLQDAMYFAYTRPDIAKIYKLSGDFLRAQKDYEMSIVSYFLSIVYDINDDVANLAKEVANEAGIDIDSEEWLSEAYMKKFFNTYKIPLMPNQKLYELAKAMGDDARSKREYKAAKFSYQLAYNLMLDDELKPVLDELSKI